MFLLFQCTCMIAKYTDKLTPVKTQITGYMAAVTLLTTLMITSWVLTDPSNSSDTCRHPRLLFPITDKPHGGFALDLECSHSMVYSAMGLQGKEEYPAIWDVVTMDNVTQGHIFRYQTYRFPSSFRSTVFFYFLLKPYGLLP